MTKKKGSSGTNSSVGLPTVSVASSESVNVEEIHQRVIPTMITPTGPTSSYIISPESTVTQNIIQQSIPMVVLPKGDLDALMATRNKLLEENSALRSQLASLSNEVTESNARIKQNDMEIDVLKREHLRTRIAVLEATVVSLVATVKELKDKNEISEVKSEFEKYIIALQDLNSLHELENHSSLPVECKTNLKKLQSFRVSSCHFHYILDDDEAHVIQHKENLIQLKLTTEMSDPCKLKFEKRFGRDFLETIVRCLSGSSSVAPAVPDDEKTEADDWWLDP